MTNAWIFRSNKEGRRVNIWKPKFSANHQGGSMDKSDLWVKVITAKRRVIDVIGCNLSHKFRSTHTYQTYTGLCGEAQMELEDGDLRRETVDMLVEYADKVIAIWQKEETK